MPKKRWIPTYEITVKISVPMAADPRPAWDAAHRAVEMMRAALPPGAGFQIVHTGPGKVELKQEGGEDDAPWLGSQSSQAAWPQPGHAATVTEQRKELSPQANEVNGLAPETAAEEISPAGKELPPHMDRRVPRPQAG